MSTEETLHARSRSCRELCAASGNLTACAVPPDSAGAIEGLQIVIVTKFVKTPA
jgi:hypothetical protein